MINLGIRKRHCCLAAIVLFLAAVYGINLYAANGSGTANVPIAIEGDATIESMETQAASLSGTWTLDGIEVYRYSANGDSVKINTGNLPANSVTGAFSPLKFDENGCSVSVIDNLTKREMDGNGAFDVSDNSLTLYVTTTPLVYTIVSEGENTMILYHKYFYSDVLYGIKLNYKKSS
jgi:hypothetical protein